MYQNNDEEQAGRRLDEGLLSNSRKHRHSTQSGNFLPQPFGKVLQKVYGMK